MIEPLTVESAVIEPSDSELVSRVREDDREAFETLYRRHVGAIYGLSRRLAGEVTKAEEMTQEVFVRAWGNRATFTSGDHFRAWLRRVAVNLRRSELRSERRWGPPVEVDFESGQAIRQRPTPTGLRRDLEQAVADLPPGARDVLVLYDVYGFKHAEIAERLGIAVGTCKVQLHRARKKLQEVLR